MLRKQHKFDEYHNDMPLIYYVEGHSLHFGRLEYALITGMRFGTIRFCLYTSADLKFRNRVFPNKVGLVITNLDVLGVIDGEVMFGNLCDKDSVCLCLILALEVIFMGRLLTCPMDDSLFGLVENLEACNVLALKRNDKTRWCEFNEDYQTQRWTEYLVDEELKLCLEEEERIRQNSMPLFYANGDKYGIPWSDVDQVFILINEMDHHWCLAHLDILSGLVTFYNSGDMYDYEWRD
ncbi:phospholipase-like protein, partial [Tanacetum coccineum]